MLGKAFRCPTVPVQRSLEGIARLTVDKGDSKDRAWGHPQAFVLEVNAGCQSWLIARLLAIAKVIFGSLRKFLPMQSG